MNRFNATSLPVKRCTSFRIFETSILENNFDFIQISLDTPLVYYEL